jgi:mono/diheme cytochrome c family protein
MNESGATNPGPGRRPRFKAVIRALVVLVILLILAGAIGYRYVVSGGLRARQSPSAIEKFVARELIQLSIPAEFKTLKNPLEATVDGADVSAGRGLYQKNCELCHGYDGSGRTAAGSGMFPVPVDLRHAAVAARKRTDGELFYFIRYGIRNTGMAGWQLPDRDTWQLVAYLRNLPKTAGRPPKVNRQGPNQPWRGLTMWDPSPVKSAMPPFMLRGKRR